jgi:hypothetical protein
MSSSKLSGPLPALNASALTNLNADSLSTGTVPNLRLNGTYSNALDLSNAGNTFTGKALSVDDSVLVVDTTNHRLGVGTANPVSTLDIQGSFGLKVLNVEGTANVEAGDAGVVVINSLNGEVTVNLPEPQEVKGRVYYFIVTDVEWPRTITASGGSIEGATSFNFFIGDFSYNRLMLVSDGVQWRILSYFNLNLIF